MCVCLYFCSIQQAFDEFFKRKSIEEQCTEESLIRLHEAFLVLLKGLINLNSSSIINTIQRNLILNILIYFYTIIINLLILTLKC